MQGSPGRSTGLHAHAQGKQQACRLGRDKGSMCIWISLLGICSLGAVVGQLGKHTKGGTPLCGVLPPRSQALKHVGKAH
jgi:hypothetical protein